MSVSTSFKFHLQLQRLIVHDILALTSSSIRIACLGAADPWFTSSTDFLSKYIRVSRIRMGFHVPEPEGRLVALPDLINPIVRLGRCTATEWNAVVFFACTTSKCSAFCGLDDKGMAPCTVDVMDQHDYDSRTWQFCRIVLPTVTYARQSQVMHYSVQCTGQRFDGHIPIAGVQDEWNLAAYSCYDQRRAIGERLWQEMSGTHAAVPRPRQTPILVCSRHHQVALSHSLMAGCCN